MRCRLNKTIRLLLLSAIFAVAMAYLEAIIVVYLRKLYYPAGFHFPLVDIPVSILLIETGREAATIIMLCTLARMIARTRQSFFACFCYTFGIWDIWYYIWLKVLLDWPASLLDWDVLFLIPLPWLGPVLAPLLVSLALIAAAVLILYYESKGQPLHFSKLEIDLEIMAALLIIISFFSELKTIQLARAPQHYPWWLFTAGMIIGLVVFIRRIYLQQHNLPLGPLPYV